MNLLDRIDAALDGLCPCGAQPRDGSAYCGPDCEPTHISDDTDQRDHGWLSTPMRWRPDLVSAGDDSDLTPLGAETHGYTGRFNAQVFERVSAPETWHLRLDDGHRFIGVDLDNVGGRQDPISVELVGRVREAWRRLERELTDPAHAVPNGVIENGPWAGWTDVGYVDETEDPWADVIRAVASHGAATIVVRPSDHNPIVRAVGEPTSATVQTQMRAINERIAAAEMPSALAVEAFLREAGIGLAEWQRSMVEQMYRSTQVVAPQIARRQAQWSDALVTAMSAVYQLPAQHVEVAGYRPAVDPDEPPTDPMQRALWLRRRRSTGPGPDRLDGRRRQRR